MSEALSLLWLSQLWLFAGAGGFDMKPVPLTFVHARTVVRQWLSVMSQTALLSVFAALLFYAFSDLRPSEIKEGFLLLGAWGLGRICRSSLEERGVSWLTARSLFEMFYRTDTAGTVFFACAYAMVLLLVLLITHGLYHRLLWSRQSKEKNLALFLFFNLLVMGMALWSLNAMGAAPVFEPESTLKFLISGT